MNCLHGIIDSIEHFNDLISINVKLHYSHMRILVLEPFTQNHQSPVKLLFKEYDILLAQKDSHVGCDNAYISPITHIIQGKILWQVFLDFQGVSIRSILTTTAANQLNIQQEKELLWCIHPNEITLKENHV